MIDGIEADIYNDLLLDRYLWNLSIEEEESEDE